MGVAAGGPGQGDGWGEDGQDTGPHGLYGGEPVRARPPVPKGTDPVTTAATMIAVAVVVLLWRLGHVSRFTVIYFAVLIPSIILHEVSHGWVANAFGDDTAKRAGRLSLNPLVHVDLFGTIIVPALLIVVPAVTGAGAGVGFGWAKPVPVNVGRLRNPRNASFWVSLAGPATNAVLFVAFALAFRFAAASQWGVDPTTGALATGPQILFLGGLANVWVGLFNLLPVPPLDGSALVERFVPARHLMSYYRMRQASMVVVFVLVFLVFRQPGVQHGFLRFALTLWNAVAGTHWSA